MIGTSALNFCPPGRFRKPGQLRPLRPFFFIECKAQTLDLYRVTNPPIKLHHLHPPPSAITPKGYLLPEFYSGATGLTGRFNEGFLLRRLHMLAMRSLIDDWH